MSYIKLENTDYSLVPVDHGNEQAWNVRIMTGEFSETIITFGNVSIDGEAEKLNFNFQVQSSPISDLDADNVDLQLECGDILSSILEDAINDKVAVMTDDEGKNVEY
jgi:hypothetical protein